MRFSVPHDHPCLDGHFPGRPLVPGVVLLERVLEAVEAAHGPRGALGVPQVKFVQPLLPDEEAEVLLVEERVEGRVRLKLYKGLARVVGRRSPNSLYSLAHVTFEEDQVYDQRDAEGFIKLNALRLRVLGRARS